MQHAIRSLTFLPRMAPVLLLGLMLSGSVFSISLYHLKPCVGTAYGNREYIDDSRGLLACGGRCLSDSACVGISSNPISQSGRSTGSGCYVHRECVTSSSCKDVTQQLKMYAKISDSQYPVNTSTWTTALPSKSCLNGGRWDGDNTVCVCKDGWVGEVCQRLATRCFELVEAGYPQGEQVMDMQYLQNPFRTVCLVSKKKAKMFIFRSSGTFNFNRTWEDYEQGFFYDNRNLWIGLKNMNVLSQAGHTKLSMFAIFTNGYRQRIFLDFLIGALDTKYALTVSRSQYVTNGNATLGLDHKMEKCFENGVPFSTYDFENSQCPEKDCASRVGAGWWFTGCDVICNPLGPRYENLPQEFANDRVFLPDFNLHNSTYAANYKRTEASYTESE